MKNANVRVVVIALGLVVAVAVLAGVLSNDTVTDAPPVTSERVSITPDAPKPTDATQAYMRLQVGSEVYPLIPLTDGGEYTITQADSGAKNVVHTTAAGAVMHFSTCDNQNCVQQGEVTLANRDLRVMGSLIVCLPNEIVVELLSAEEVQGQ